MQKYPRILGFIASAFVVSSAGCGKPHGGDAITYPDASPLGAGLRLRDVNDPASKERPQTFPQTPWSVGLTGSIVTAIDTFDETHDGKSFGAIYLQDADKAGPFSGISTFGTTFVPSSLRVAPGDVLDCSGTYQENANIGTAVFNPGTFLPQLYRPTAIARFEYAAPTPVDIDIEELRTFETGRKWIGVLVRVSNVTLAEPMRQDRVGRVSGKLLAGTDRNLPTMTNELFDLGTDDYEEGTTFASVTGMVTFFYSLHIAPRSRDDIQP